MHGGVGEDGFRDSDHPSNGRELIRVLAGCHVKVAGIHSCLLLLVDRSRPVSID
jgi:hypothetical protein